MYDIWFSWLQVIVECILGEWRVLVLVYAARNANKIMHYFVVGWNLSDLLTSNEWNGFRPFAVTPRIKQTNML